MRNLFLLRNALGITQSDMSNKLGISQGYLSEIESGKKTNLSLPLLKALYLELNTTEAWLFSNKGWSYYPSKPNDSIEFVKRQIEKFHVNEIIIVSYRDLAGGIPKGFIFRHTDHILSMDGENTRSGYAGKGPNAYDEILNLLKESKITVGYVTPNESMKINRVSDRVFEHDFSETDLSTLLPFAKYDQNIIENEFKELIAGDHKKEPEISLTTNESTLIYMIRKTNFDIFELMKYMDLKELEKTKKDVEQKKDLNKIIEELKSKSDAIEWF